MMEHCVFKEKEWYDEENIDNKRVDNQSNKTEYNPASHKVHDVSPLES